MCLQEVFGVDAESADCQSQISLEVCLLDQLNTRATGRSGGGAEHCITLLWGSAHALLVTSIPVNPVCILVHY